MRAIWRFADLFVQYRTACAVPLPFAAVYGFFNKLLASGPCDRERRDRRLSRYG